ncbi:hypothetical protein KGQ20_13665 [Catenulispora sp. NF23]|uniref:hypothetical protein n=1 Tax=Catenulispora pinistramenti TaxID=2705254 RepID=UPI001BA6197F|nr:hypothetical protein [Catenulispora pinistramenti]MBS2533815.1 hypothetical protein [Catenulispora pinistramenti]
MTDSDLLTAGRYGYTRRRIHRDDFAQVLARFLPPEGANRFRPVIVVPSDDLATAAKLCSHLAARFPGERLGAIAEVAARQLRHPATPAGYGQLLLYPAALLCRELQALSAIEAATSIAAVLEEHTARRTAAALETAISAEVRYPAQVMFDGDFVRTAAHARSA